MAGSDNFEPYNYDPSMAAAATSIILFAPVTLLHTYQCFERELVEVVGYIGRGIGAHQTPDWTLGPYILQAILLLVAPTLFAASIYMELGRIILLTDGEAHAIIRRAWLTKIFVVGDVVSFLCQAGGKCNQSLGRESLDGLPKKDCAGLLSRKSKDTVKAGQKIILAGLAIQILFFSFFFVVGLIFRSRMLKVPTRKVLHGERLPWQKHLFVLYSASVLILVRSVFRFVEYAQGKDGYLISHEVYLYIVDAALMFATMVLFAWHHPSEINALLKGNGSKAVKYGLSLYRLG